MSRRVNLAVLEDLRIASPCSARWEDMAGDERVRFCGRCKLHVYDLSAMSRGEAEELVASATGRLCARFYRRVDGTVLTRDCPVALRAARMRLAAGLSRIAAALMLLVGGSVAFGWGRLPGAARLRGIQPFASVCEWLSAAPPAPPAGPFMGDVCVVPRPAAPSPASPTTGGR